MQNLTKNFMIILAALAFATAAIAGPSKEDGKKLNEAAAVVTALRDAPDSGIPERVWDKAECVVVIPGLKKGGFIIGGEFGSGVMSCKNSGTWGAPLFMQMTKGSAGLQAGVQSTDLVLVVMNKGGADKLLDNKVTLGGDASVAAGPVGRAASAGTDARMTAEILSYSRAKGLFAGIDVSGGSLKPDGGANTRMYGAGKSARDIAMGNPPVAPPAEARGFHDALTRGVAATSGVK